jgi:predicted nuclease with TOPRIM domain
MKLIFRMEDSLRTEMRAIVDRLRQLETNVEKQNGELETLRQEYFALRQGLARLEKPVEALEKKVVTRTDLRVSNLASIKSKRD